MRPRPSPTIGPMRDELFIGGEWTASSSGGWIPVENPATEELVTRVPDATADDVDRAVAAARAAFDKWAAAPPDERARVLAALRDALRARQSEMARLITTEMGAPLKLANGPQTALPIGVLSSYVDLLREPAEPERMGNSVVLREPVGVVGAITPWNYPLHQAMAKIAPALAAGNTVVHKPSEVTPLSALLLAEIAQDAGVPRGVYNVVTGTGPAAGEALAAHPGVDTVSFTGSTRAGRRVAAIGAETVKKVTLELGGKSACIVLDSADLNTAVKVCVANCFLNSGQSCNAWTRLLVPASRRAEAAGMAATAAAKYTVGDPTDPQTRLGPLVSSAQRDRVRAYMRSGIDDGARVVTGGPEADGLPPRGYFVAPTIFDGVTPSMTIAQEEIFGPVLSIIEYGGVDDAVAIANDTVYGLAAAVWGEDEEAMAVARRLRAGQVDINGGAFNLMAPFGGYKQSGVGRELGRYGLEEFQLVKSVQLP